MNKVNGERYRGSFLGLRLNSDERQKLEALAEELGSNRSEVVRELIQRAKIGPTVIEVDKALSL